jgi:hypothetical protein
MFFGFNRQGEPGLFLPFSGLLLGPALRLEPYALLLPLECAERAL